MGKKRILIVDDEQMFCNSVKYILEETGSYEVLVESIPNKVLETARRFQPHLILLDVIMPHRSGDEIASDLRRDDNLKTTPIIFLTSIVSAKERSRDGKIGGNIFIGKPASIDLILQRIRENLPE